jgi:hypothetical protein
MPTTQFEVSEIDDEYCTDALIDRTTGTRVRVIDAAAAFAALICSCQHMIRMIRINFRCGKPRLTEVQYRERWPAIVWPIIRALGVFH